MMNEFNMVGSIVQLKTVFNFIQQGLRGKSLG